MKVRGPDGTLYDFPEGTKDTEIESFFNPPGEVKLPPEYMRVNMAGIGPFGPPAPEEVLSSPFIRLGIAERQLAGKAIETVGETATDLAGAALAEYGILPPERGKGLLQLDSYPVTAAGPAGLLLRKTRPDVAQKLDVAAGELISGFTEPGLLLTAPLGGTRAGAAYFLGATAQAIPEQIQAMAEAPGLPEFSAEALKTGANVAMGGLLGRGLLKPGVRALREGVPDASRIQEAAEVHGDVRAQPREGAGEVPVQESRAGVQPQAARGLGEETQVLLNQSAEVNRSLGLGHEIEVLDNFGSDDVGNVKLFRATPASVDANGNFLAPGKISLSRAALNLLSEQVSPEVLAKTLQSTLIEEGIHALTTPGESAVYLTTLTGPEIALGRKLYLKGWTEREAGLQGKNYLGYELLRRRVQQLMGLETSEIADLAGRERWTAKSLEFLANLIRRFRELIRTGAAKGGQAIAQGVLDRMERNLEAAKGKVAEGVSPPVVRNVPRGSIPLQSIVPAIRLVGGELVPGKPGETHPDIIKRAKLKAEDIDQRGFSDPTGKGFFLDREAAAQGTDIATEMEPERMHSTDQIREMEEPGGVETEPPAGAAPPAEPGVETPFALRRRMGEIPEWASKELRDILLKADKAGSPFKVPVADEWAKLTPVQRQELSELGWSVTTSRQVTGSGRLLIGHTTDVAPNRLRKKVLESRGLTSEEGVASLRRQHEQDMDFARRLLKMDVAQFMKEASGFNKINLRLGENATWEDLAELEDLRQQAYFGVKEAREAYDKDSSQANQEKYVTAMQKPQFYNEAIQRHYEVMAGFEPQALDPRTGQPLSATESIISRLEPKKFPAALRRRMAKELPVPLRAPMRMNYRRQTGGDINEPARLDDVVSWYALRSEREWGLPEGLKDQIQGWFKSQVNGPFDRLNMIISEIRALENRAPEPPDYVGDFTESGVPLTEGQKIDLPELARWEALIDDPNDTFAEITRLQALATQEIRNRNVAPEAYVPAALRRKKPAGPELPMGKITPSGRLTQPERGPAAAQLAAHEAATFQPLTANSLVIGGDEYFASTTTPSLEDYTGTMSRRFGPMKPGQLREQFEEAFWRWANTATGKQVTDSLKDLGLAKRLRIESPTGALRKIADAPAVSRQLEMGPATGQRQVPGLNRPHFVMPGAPLAAPMQGPARPIYGPYDVPFAGRTPSGSRLLQTPAQRLRAQALASIAEKLIVEGEGSRSFLKRKEIDPVEELADPRVETKQPVYHEIDQRLEADPAKLGQTLTEDARAFGGEKVSRVVGGQVVTVRKKGFPVSASKRLTAIQNRDTGKVSLVSTYRDGRRGAVMVDPSIPGAGAHSTVERILQRYRVIASTLLDEPVQDFRKDYADLGSYQRQFGSDARTAGERGLGYQPPPGIVEAEAGRTAPSEAVTPDEAARIMDQLLGEVGKVESVDDVKLAWENLKDDPASRAALTGLRKLGREILRQEPGIGAEQFLDKLARLIYENHTQAQTLEDFQRRTMEASRPPSGKAPGVEAVPEPAAAAPTGREIVIADPRRLPPGLKGALRRPEPVTQYGTARPEEPPQRLTPEEAEYVGTEEYRRKMGSLPTAKETRAEAQFKAGEDFDRIISEAYYAAQEAAETGEEGPAALRRKHYSVADESRRIQAGISAAYKRRDIMREIPTMLDVSENVSHDEAFRWENHIRGVTRKKTKGLFYGDPKVLSGANPLIAAGAIVPQYTWNPINRLILRNRMDAHPGAPRAKKLMRSADPAERDQGRAMFGRIRRESIQGMVHDGELPAEAPSYTFDTNTLPMLDRFEQLVEQGMRKAERLAIGGGWKGRIKAAAWKAGAQKLLDELQYARTHWGDADLVETATRMRRVLDMRYDRERANGYRMKYDTTYLPGRYDAEFFNDNSVLFGKPSPRILGKLWRKPKSFRNYYEAIAEDAYIAMTRDGANIVAHRVRQGERQLQYKQWVDSLLDYRDPASNDPVALKAKRLPTGGFGSPSPAYELRYLRPGHDPIAIHNSYIDLIDQITQPSAIQKWAPTRFTLEWAQRLKHTILLGDFFHLSRLSYYGLSIMGIKESVIRSPFRRGLTALEFREEDLPEAVRNGIISQAEATWATERIPVRFGSFVQSMSRIDILREFERTGLNVGRIQDAIYKDLVKSVPLLGPYNKWLFDRFTRGLMAQSAIMEFERQHKANPELAPPKLMKEIVKDINMFYGSIGRQGWIKSKTMQDLSRMLFLAPQWVEGLVDKEIYSAARIAGTSLHAMGLYRKGMSPLGTMGRGIGRGMLAMLVLTQVLNLISRRKPTWENEEGHKWDAWIPTRDGKGLYLSPLAVFNELSHDLVRLGHSKPRFIDAIDQIGSNKLSPWGRLGIVLYTGLTPTREYIPSTGGVLGTAAEQLVPVPISFGRITQAAGHAVAPGLVPPTAPGAVERQMLATFGLKAEPAAQAALLTTRMAEDFVQKEYGKTQSIKILPTTEPSYSKLRNALRVKDFAAASRILKVLQQTKSDRDIVKAMKLWARHPFTGANKYEKEFLDSLNPEQQAIYDKAVEQKEAEYQQFLDWFSNQQQ